jgi:hypothetical protein
MPVIMMCDNSGCQDAAGVRSTGDGDDALAAIRARNGLPAKTGI